MLLAFLEMLLMWGFQFSLLRMVIPRYLVLSTVLIKNCSMDCILRLYYVFTFVGYPEHLTLVRVEGATSPPTAAGCSGRLGEYRRHVEI